MTTKSASATPLHGWLNLDKPAGLTSAAAVGRIKRLFRPGKIGHGGTLDPAATGVLPIAFGEATKTVAYIMDGKKRYRFAVRWGEARDTDDAEGAVIASSPTRPSEGDIAQALDAFRGEISQVPPAYSAIKVAGRRAYDLARGGTPAELAPRNVQVHGLALEKAARDEAVFALECGKGTYVRSIARDLAVMLGTVGHVGWLRRTAVGKFDESRAISLANVESLVHSAALAECLLPVESALADIPALDLTEQEANCLRNGQAVPSPGDGEGIVYARRGERLVALAMVESGLLRPLRVFNL